MTKQFLNYLWTLLPYIFLKLRWHGFSFERPIQIKSPGRLRLGKNVIIQRDSILHCGGKKWCNFDGEIILGDHVVIGPKCVIYGTGKVRLGAFTHLGPGVVIMSQSGLPNDNRMTTNPDISFEAIKIGKGCWIGAGAVVLGGTTLGDHCIVGPNSVVKGNYPDTSVLVGNPARVSAQHKNRPQA